MKLRRSHVLFGLFLICQSVHADPETGRKIDYDELNGMAILATQLKSPFSEIRAFVTPQSKSIKLEAVKLWLEIDGTPQMPIDIQADGTFILPALSDAQAKHAQLAVNQAKGDVSLSVSAKVNPPQTLEVSYQDLFLILTDTEALIDEIAGAASWFVPTPDDLSFKFDQPANIKIADKVYKTNDENLIAITRNKKMYKQNPTVVFSRLPLEINPE
ncbi:DUF2987 domain-containing protein [Bowmanella sp. JS7-9]|uniref:DUF2987 domain-containing protein n=1 Tax=Pseudobowmanella zhangzhouensis TaxID=1537679 RepID=A0ABW1XK94_9ALTE|nr:DUF2987 domain-containing protein [Bowmanella sp. JS7-9]TBX24483.1 hypothetical protein TK45_04995 [Bowmanella sp. JS7-9]